MRKFLIATAVLLCFASSQSFAQTSNATLGGTVADATGALIPGVSVTATNTGTGIVTTGITNEAGAYNFASLQTGTYTVSAELPGFQTQTYNGVLLGVSQQVRLNFTLQIGSVATAVEVSVSADTLLATSSTSVGSVLPEYKVRDLPLAGRDVLDLIKTTGGTQTSGSYEGVFAGQRLSAVNTTRDGIVVTDGRYENGAYSATFTSPDLVEEVRIIVSPADAETSRGSGQVQMVTRSGTNQFRGSLFWTGRNSALDANSWENNFNGAGKDYENRNQFGGRLGGPIIRNKTFFFFLFEGQRYIARESALGTVLTGPARQGIYRYFPGADNQNATDNAPVVDFAGNPIRPAGATGDLTSFNVFTRDPLRPGPDMSPISQEIMRRMPLPNDFTTGDGLNIAGIRWTRRIEGLDLSNGNGPNVNRDQYNMRIDHNFNSSHKLSLVGTKEKTWAMASQAGITAWPTGYSGIAIKRPDVYSISLVSTLSTSLLNEFRMGRRRTLNWQYTPVDRPDEIGRESFSYLPQSNGIPFNVVPNFYGPHFLNKGGFGGYRGALNPLKSIGDTLSWTRGKHAFKGGVEWRLSASDGFNSPHYLPFANIGPGAFAVQGIDTSVPGLIAQNHADARNLLLNLAGSIGSVNQAFGIKDAKDLTFYGYPDIKVNGRFWHQTEFSGFFKDDWKLRSNLTLNMGVHYEWFGVPYEEFGRAAIPVGHKAGLCGIACGALTTVEFVGKNSTQPDKQMDKNDWNNIAPSVGLSWNLPWWGQDKTVLRVGYGISYLGAVRDFRPVDSAGGSIPGAVHHTSGSGTTYTPSTYTTISSLTLPMPQLFKPLEPAPLTDRTASITVFDRVSPYVQNFNVELQREIARNLTVEVRYIGAKSTKLWDSIPLNRVDIFNSGILEAFNITRAGGDAPLFNQMLNGINIGGGASVVNGTTYTGSMALRANSTTRPFIANGNVGSLANFLNTNSAGTQENGGLLRRNGFPENFIVMNPQFNGVAIAGNPSNSTYHALQLQMTKRLSGGFTNQTVYTWSRSIGANGEVDYRNRQLDKTLLDFHRTHDLVSSGSYELPFGPGRLLFGNAPAVVQRLVERWQLGAIFSLASGGPLSFTTGLQTISNGGEPRPNLVGNLPKSTGEVKKVDNGVIYFEGLSATVDTRAMNTVTPAQSAQGSFSNRMIVDAQGNVLLTNPEPGTYGNLGQNWIEGPGSIGLDMNLVKRVRIAESKEFEFRVDAINVLNHPNFGNPNTNINATNFGRITTATGNRQFVLNLRLNF